MTHSNMPFACHGDYNPIGLATRTSELNGSYFPQKNYVNSTIMSIFPILIHMAGFFSSVFPGSG